MKYAAAALVFALSMLAQSGDFLPACGLGGNDNHPCHCLMHVEEVQGEHMRTCMANSDPKRKISEVRTECLQSMPSHCDIVEHYGNWSVGEDGEHDKPMPQQCRRACTRSHCRCADGPQCHFAHSPEDDKK